MLNGQEKKKNNIIKTIFKFLDNKSKEQVSKTKALESNYLYALHSDGVKQSTELW